MRYAILGAAGYIAPRHMQAITDLGGEIVLACDISDSVGILDKYAPDCRFTCDPREFFALCQDVDVVSVCTPNYLHVQHAISALKAECDVVLEKPIATCAIQAEELIRRARHWPGTIYPVVQLRHHQGLPIDLQEGAWDVEIDYAVYRGDWYDRSWKGDAESGGLLMNIGIHLFDLCLHLFGDATGVVASSISPRGASGIFTCERATVRWGLTRSADEPRRIFRAGDVEIDLSSRFARLHTEVYRHVMTGESWALGDVARAVGLVDEIKRRAE